MTFTDRASVSPPITESNIDMNSGHGRVGAVGDPESDEEFGKWVEGMQVEGDADADAVAEESEVAGPDADAEGQVPMVRRAPVKPSPDEVDRHNTTHIPRRAWCKVCVEAAIQEDPHHKSGVDHKSDGIPEVHMDYKEIRKGKRPFLVMRERSSGATFGVRTQCKGDGDIWAVKRCNEKLSGWGLETVRLTIRSDGEPAIKAFRQAMKDDRKAETTFGTSPPRDPQANGVAERAVQEFTSQLRRVKLGLESRIGATIANDHVVVDWMAQHAGFLISKFLRGSQDGFTAH